MAERVWACPCGGRNLAGNTHCGQCGGDISGGFWPSPLFAPWWQRIPKRAYIGGGIFLTLFVYGSLFQVVRQELAKDAAVREIPPGAYSLALPPPAAVSAPAAVRMPPAPVRAMPPKQPRPPSHDMVRRPTPAASAAGDLSFEAVDAVMTGEGTTAQLNAYWKRVVGKHVAWTGQIVNVRDEGGGELVLKCNPRVLTYDTLLELDGTQVKLLTALNTGDRVTFGGVLAERHQLGGYTLTHGRVLRAPVSRATAPTASGR